MFDFEQLVCGFGVEGSWQRADIANFPVHYAFPNLIRYDGDQLKNGNAMILGPVWGGLDF